MAPVLQQRIQRKNAYLINEQSVFSNKFSYYYFFEFSKCFLLRHLPFYVYLAFRLRKRLMMKILFAVTLSLGLSKSTMLPARTAIKNVI